MNPTASGIGAIAVAGSVSNSTIFTGDITILIQGINALRTDYSTRIKRFLAEYLGTSENPVPFGGREESLALLDAWLDNVGEPPYLLLAAPAGQGQSAVLAHWCQRLLSREDVAVAFIPVSIRFRTNLASVVFSALTARLAALHQEPLTADASTPVEVWRGMIADYLARPLPGRRRLLLVLDGLDEAADWDAGPDLFPADPGGLRVVASARLRAGESDAGPWLASLGWDRRGLSRPMELGRLSREGVQDVLIRMGCPLDELGRRVDIVAELHRLSEGEPLVVRLFVEDLRERKAVAPRLRPEDLEAIPPGLKGYLDQWWKHQESLWDTRKENPLERPLVRLLLKLFTFTIGPLTQTDILRLATMALPQLGMDSLLLKAALRPLNRLVVGDGRNQGYVFGHPRMAFHFSEEFAADRDGIESLLLGWGQEELEAINNGFRSSADASAYLVQYYAAHLELADQGADALLRLVCDGWRIAWEALEGGHGGFMHDVRRAWRAVSRVNTADAVERGTVNRLGGEIRCAICEASVRSLVGSFPPALLKAAVEQGLWSPSQVLGYSRLMPESYDRVEVVAAVADHLEASVRNAALEEVLAIAQEIENESDRAKSIANLAPHLPEALRLPALREVIEIARTSKGEFYRLWAIEALAPHINGTLVPEAFSAALGIEDEYERGCAVIALAPSLPEQLLSEAFAAVMGTKKLGHRLNALASLVPYMTGTMLEDSLEMAREIESVSLRSMVHTAVASHLPEPRRGEFVAEALLAARGITDWNDRAKALTALVTHLPEQLRDEVLWEALAALFEAPADVWSSWMHSGLSERLVALAPHLAGDLLQEALTAARALGHEHHRGNALTALVARVPEASRGPILDEALAAVRSAGRMYEYVTPGALADLVPYLPESHREPVLQEALAAAQSIGDDYHRRVALKDLAPRLTNRVLLTALTGVRTIRDHVSRFCTLAAMAAYLPESLRTTVLDEYLEASLSAARTWGESDEGVYALYPLIPYLTMMPSGKSLEIITELLEKAHADEDDFQLMDAIIVLAPHLPARLLPEILADVPKTRSSFAQAATLEALAPHLPDYLLTQALAHARAIHEKAECVRALAAVLPHLPNGLRRRALSESLAKAWAVLDKESRLQTVCRLAPHLSDNQRRSVLGKALAETRDIWVGLHRADVVVALAPHLSGEQAVQVLEQGHRTMNC